MPGPRNWPTTLRIAVFLDQAPPRRVTAEVELVVRNLHVAHDREVHGCAGGARDAVALLAGSDHERCRAEEGLVNLRSRIAGARRRVRAPDARTEVAQVGEVLHAEALG